MACGRQVQDGEAAKAESHARALFGPDTSVVGSAANSTFPAAIVAALLAGIGAALA